MGAYGNVWSGEFQQFLKQNAACTCLRLKGSNPLHVAIDYDTGEVAFQHESKHS